MKNNFGKYSIFYPKKIFTFHFLFIFFNFIIKIGLLKKITIWWCENDFGKYSIFYPKKIFTFHFLFKLLKNNNQLVILILVNSFFVMGGYIYIIIHIYTQGHYAYSQVLLMLNFMTSVHDIMTHITIHFKPDTYDVSYDI